MRDETNSIPTDERRDPRRSTPSPHRDGGSFPPSEGKKPSSGRTFSIGKKPSGTPPPFRWPAPVRWAIRLAVFPWMLLDLAAQAAVRTLFPPRYKILGKCKKRGLCCQYIFLEWPAICTKYRLIGKLWMWWHSEILGFYDRNIELEESPQKGIKVMGCRYLSPEGLCKVHFFRPSVCRLWPRPHPYEKPHTLPGCGYFAVLRTKSSEKSPQPDRKNLIIKEKK